jgi:hypothetical protein
MDDIGDEFHHQLAAVGGQDVNHVRNRVGLHPLISGLMQKKFSDGAAQGVRDLFQPQKRRHNRAGFDAGYGFFFDLQLVGDLNLRQTRQFSLSRYRFPH